MSSLNCPMRRRALPEPCGSETRTRFCIYAASASLRSLSLPRSYVAVCRCRYLARNREHSNARNLLTMKCCHLPVRRSSLFNFNSYVRLPLSLPLAIVAEHHRHCVAREREHRHACMLRLHLPNLYHCFSQMPEGITVALWLETENKVTRVCCAYLSFDCTMLFVLGRVKNAASLITATFQSTSPSLAHSFCTEAT